MGGSETELQHSKEPCVHPSVSMAAMSATGPLRRYRRGGWAFIMAVFGFMRRCAMPAPAAAAAFVMHWGKRPLGATLCSRSQSKKPPPRPNTHWEAFGQCPPRAAALCRRRARCAS